MARKATRNHIDAPFAKMRERLGFSGNPKLGAKSDHEGVN